jgi:hypothetical protein
MQRCFFCHKGIFINMVVYMEKEVDFFFHCGERILFTKRNNINLWSEYT